MSIKNQILKLKEEWKLEEIIEVAEDFLYKNPYDKDIVLELVNACWHLAQYSKLEEYSKLLLEHNDCRSYALNMLIYALSRLDRKDEARNIIKDYPRNAQNYEKIMLKNYLYNSNSEKESMVNNLLWSSFNNMLYTIQEKINLNYNGITIGESSYKVDEKIIILKKALKLYEIMYEEEDFFSEAIMVMNIHIALSVLYLQINMKEECYNHLEKAQALCIYFHSYNINEKYKSIFLKESSVEAKTRWSIGAKKSMLDDLNLDFFNEIRNEARFLNIYENIVSIL